jgi:type II secretory pathway component PulK
MRTTRHHAAASDRTPSRERGSVLVVVMWIAFGLISITLYFANSMTYEVRASDNRVAGEEAELAIDGYRRYLTCVLSNLNSPGAIPDTTSYACSGVQIGNATVYLIGRTNVENSGNYSNLTYGLIPESSKLNLNNLPGGLNAGGSNLALLPRMTLNLAYNIMAWESTNTANSVGGAESDTYMMQSPPYLCKNAPYETVDELRLVYQMTPDILYGEDANLNGILDPNENDGDVLPPTDNMDGRLDPGILEYLTVYSAEPANDTNGNPRVNVTAANAATQLMALLETNFDSGRVQQIEAAAGLLSGGGGPPVRGRGGPPPPTTAATFTSPLQFYIQSGMTQAEFAQIEPSLRGNTIKGLLNIDTASSMVLQCIPNVDTNVMQQLVAARAAILTDPNNQNTVAWVTQVLTPQQATQIGPYITARSYQFTADVAAVGHDGRGYRRTRFVFDTSTGTPVIVYRQDLTHLGWALGAQVRSQLMAAK